MATNAELQGQLAHATGMLEQSEKRVKRLTADLSKERERANDNAKARQDAEADVDRLGEELRAANASLKAYKGSATRARAEATVLKRELSPQARPIGAMKPTRNDEEAAARAAALEAAFARDLTELVFSDGRREIRELAPLSISGDAWLQRANCRELNDAPILEPVGERQEVELRGFALLNEAGEQVGYRELPTPIVIGRSQKMRIPHGSIFF